MSRRRIADPIVRCLREAGRDLAEGLTVAEVCRKLGIAENTCYRWRRQHGPAQVEIERLKKLVVELLLDKRMLQGVAKSGDTRAAACRRLAPDGTLCHFPAPGQPAAQAGALHTPLPTAADTPRRRRAYNTIRPRGALDGDAPRKFGAACDRRQRRARKASRDGSKLPITIRLLNSHCARSEKRGAVHLKYVGQPLPGHGTRLPGCVLG